MCSTKIIEDQVKIRSVINVFIARRPRNTQILSLTIRDLPTASSREIQAMDKGRGI